MTTERVHVRWPVLAARIEAALHAAGEPKLAAALGAVDVIKRCSCQDDFCQSFYTGPPPKNAYGEGHRCVALDAPRPGYLVLDVVNEKIMYVEVASSEKVQVPGGTTDSVSLASLAWPA